MNWINFDIPAFIVQYLGKLFNRLYWHRWIYSLLYPLIQLWSNYKNWRENTYYLININSQVIRLEGYLNDVFDPSLRRIYISHFPGNYSGIYIALQYEATPFVNIPLLSDGQDGVFIGLASETSYAISFIINVPTALQYREHQIKTIVEKYKFAGKLYQLNYY